jgi:hypothetical protein
VALATRPRLRPCCAAALLHNCMHKLRKQHATDLRIVLTSHTQTLRSWLLEMSQKVVSER